MWFHIKKPEVKGGNSPYLTANSRELSLTLSRNVSKPQILSPPSSSSSPPPSSASISRHALSVRMIWTSSRRTPAQYMLLSSGSSVDGALGINSHSRGRSPTFLWAPPKEVDN